MKSNNDILLEFNDYVESQKYTNEPINLYDPINYILENGGKRIRPILVLLAGQLFSENNSDTLPLAYAIEMFHNFTLLHDDIMDDASLRRGKPTVHTKYNVSAGILSGDAMLLYSYKYLQLIQDADLALNIQKEFTDIGIRICEGQQMDMDFEVQDDVSVAQYIEMIKLKTAILLGLSLKIGGMANNASLEDQDHLEQFGINLGIAFQIQDDILDVFGDDNKFGKISGGDIIQNKKTYLYLKSLEMSSPDQREMLTNLYATKIVENEKEKINKVKDIFNTLVVVEYAKQVMEAYTDLAFSHLDAISVEDKRKENLKSIASKLMVRNH